MHTYTCTCNAHTVQLEIWQGPFNLVVGQIVKKIPNRILTNVFLSIVFPTALQLCSLVLLQSRHMKCMWHVKALLNNSTMSCTCGDSSLSKKEIKRASKEVTLVLGKGNGILLKVRALLTRQEKGGKEGSTRPEMVCLSC